MSINIEYTELHINCTWNFLSMYLFVMFELKLSCILWVWYCVWFLKFLCNGRLVTCMYVCMYVCIYVRVEINSSNISMLWSWNNPKSFFHRFEGLYIELCACKTSKNWAFESLNESIGTGSSSKKAGPAGYTWVSHVIDAICQAHLQNGLVS